MLQQKEEQPLGYVSPIANLRVTPQELAQAVAAIESQRDGVGQDTIAIGEAIDQLGLSVSPQEVYAEIRRQQAAKQEATIPVAVAPTVKRRGTFRRLLLAGVIAGSLMFNFIAMMALSRAPYTSMPVSVPPMQMEKKIRTADITLERPGYATLYQLNELAKGASPSSISLRTTDFGNQVGEAQWKVIRLNGQLMVSGWTYPDGHFNANVPVSGERGNFFSHSIAGDPVPRTVLLESFGSITDPKWITTEGSEGVSIPLSSPDKR